MRGKNEVGLSAFSFLFSEFIQYSQLRVNTAEELERKYAWACTEPRPVNRLALLLDRLPPCPCPRYRRLEDAGVGIGLRVLELGCLREKSSKRETRMLGILNFITSVVWKMLFGNAADSLEKSVEQEDEFMIVEKAPVVNAYISNAPCSCAAFVAGIVRGVLEGSHFPAKVSAHEQDDNRTVILIKFAPEVLDREKRLA
jgi:hypothetical protein